MDALLLWSPASGGGRAGRFHAAVADRLRADGLHVAEHRTASLDDARDMAAKAAMTEDLVLAMGGDGLLGAAAAGVAAAGPWAAGVLGVIPAGGGNDAAAALGLPARDPLAAAALVPALSARPIDLARLGDRLFVNIAGAGFDSEVNRLANRFGWLPGRARYVGALLAELAVGKVAGFALRLDGRALAVEGWLVAVANGPSYGSGMRIAPAARLDDGLLDVVVIGRLSKPGFLRCFPSVFSGRHVEHPAVSVHRAARVTVAADRPLAVFADGEPAGGLPAGIEIVPAALRVLAAADAPGLTPAA